MQEVGLNQLLEAGVHFGHQTRRWNPKMRKYIFTERNGIHIIDLRKTLDRLQAAQKAIQEVVGEDGDRVLFVCTKDQLRGIIEEEAQRCGAFYVTERWLGGMLTNFQTIKKQIRRLKEIERGQEEDAFDYYTKKERLLLDRERQKLEKYLSGVKDMGRLPGAIFVVDAKREIIAVREANRLDIPVIAITDTNADPDLIDYPIPGNDDAIRSVSLITKAIADSVVRSKRDVSGDERRLAEDMEATTYSTETGETEVEEQPRSKKEKKKRKRVPRPEVIERHRKGGDDDDLEDLEDELDELEDEEIDADDEDQEAPEAEEADEEEEPIGEAGDDEAEETTEARGEDDAEAEDEAVEAEEADEEKEG